jgi:hypothetical protein
MVLPFITLVDILNIEERNIYCDSFDSRVLWGIYSSEMCTNTKHTLTSCTIAPLISIAPYNQTSPYMPACVNVLYNLDEKVSKQLC